MVNKPNSKKVPSFSAAFTVVEVGVIVPIVLIVVGAFILTLVNFTGKAIEARKENAIAVDVQGVINRIANDVADSNLFLSENDFAVQSPQGSGDNTTKFTNVSTPSGSINLTNLILKTPLTKSNPLTAPNDVDNSVYKPNSPLACTDVNIVNNQLATYNIVYFSKTVGSNIEIYRRSIMPLNYTTTANACTTPWQKPTCASGKTGTYCSGGVDERVSLDYSMHLTPTYYSEDIELPSARTIASSASAADRQLALDTATSVKINIKASKVVDNIEQTYTAERILPLN